MATNTHNGTGPGGPGIASYLDLIQYEGKREPTQAVLHDLHVRHTRSIAFENLSPFTGMTVDLSIDALMNKFTTQRRGGYCYEHNSLFQYVLQEMGFTTQGLAARVRLHVPDDVLTPRSHMLLLVEAEGETFIADTGFGGLTLTAPIRFVSDVVQDTPHGPYRLLRTGDDFCLQTKAKHAWQDLYIFDLVKHYPPDYEVFNWYTSSYPTSHFIDELIVARPAQAGRHALRNRQYSFYHLDGRAEKNCLIQWPKSRKCLKTNFG